MAPTSRAEDAARRLLADAAARGAPAADAAVAAVRAVDVLQQTLARWFGPHGADALLGRALAEARRHHPVLATVRLRAPLAPVLDAPVLGGLVDASSTHGSRAAVEGVTSVLVAAIDLLGRMIGEGMALQIVAQAVDLAPPPGADAAPTGSPTEPTQGSTDGAADRGAP